MKNKGLKILSLFLILLLTLSITIASHQPSINVSMIFFDGFDKVAHFIVYFLYGLSVQFFVVSWFTKSRKTTQIILAVLISLAFASIDEFHQSYIYGRDASLYDLLADIIGIAVSFIFFNKIHKTFNKD